MKFNIFKNNNLFLFIFLFGFIWYIIFIIYITTKMIFQSNKMVIENFNDMTLLMNKNDSFCESHRGSSDILEQSCGNLTENNCKSVNCCVWTSNNKCVAGGKNGPTFNTDKNGKTKTLDYYYNLNKCYGNKCPNS